MSPRSAFRTPRGWLGSVAPALALATVLVASTAQAVSIQSISVALNGANSANLLVDTNPPPPDSYKNPSALY
jgi:hypothetical protein